MKTALIISGGDFCHPDPSIEYDYVIACDRGLEYAKSLGIEVDLALGDFDSIDGGYHFDNSYKLLKYPAEKDDTDTMLAIKAAISNDFERIIIICALGGRIDHTLANVQSMTYAAKHDVICEIYSDKEYLRTVKGPGKINIQKNSGHSLSLLSLTDECTGVCITGAKYNADNIVLTNSFPLGHGNSWEEEQVTVSVSDGILLIIESILE